MVEQILKRIAKVWEVDDNRIRWKEPSGHEAAGFEWWPGDFRVRVRADYRKQSGADSVIRVTVRTDFLKDVAIDNEHFEQMSTEIAGYSTSTYAWVYPPQDFWQKYGDLSEESPRLWFSSSVYVVPETISWMPDLLATTALMQPINAQLQARALAEILGSGVPDVTRPAELQDAGLDDMLEVAAQIYAPLGEQPSRWAGTDEFEQFAQTWGRADNCFGTADPNQMTLETPFGDDSALIRFLTTERHPQLGHGLLVTLQLPYSGDRLTMVRAAAWLNFFEASTWTDFPQLGCWYARENRQQGVAFALFMPNALYRPITATNLAFSFLLRARWARELMFPDLQDAAMIDVFERRHLGETKH
jgi:hypothetical protein